MGGSSFTFFAQNVKIRVTPEYMWAENKTTFLKEIKL